MHPRTEDGWGLIATILIPPVTCIARVGLLLRDATRRQEIQASSRSLTHRPSLSSTMPTSGLANRQSHSRTSSQSIVLGPGPLHSKDRVTRRKSMNNGTPNVAAIEAAIKDAGDASASLPSSGFGRRHTVSKGVGPRGASTSLLTSKLMADRKAEIPEHAIDDDPATDGTPNNGAAAGQQKSRVRRASDGQPLTKEGRKSNRVELRCEKCGKGYKHSSCLTKHLFVSLLPYPRPRHLDALCGVV